MTPEQEAKDPSTKPARLRELAEQNKNPNGDINLFFFLVKNPNTPTETLLSLGEMFAEQLLENPAFSLLFFEHPDFISKIPKDTLESLLELEALPLWFLEALIVSPTKQIELQKLAQRDEVSGDFLEKLVAHASLEVRQIAASAKVLSPAQAQRLAADQSPHVLRHLAANPTIPAELLEELTISKDVTIRLASAKNPRATASQLQRLAADVDAIRQEVARHKNTPPETLASLAKNPENVVKEYQARTNVAGNPQTPVAVLEALYQNQTLPPPSPIKFGNFAAQAFDSYRVYACQALAQNPNTPVKILEELAQHEQYTVRQWATHNAKLPQDTLERLARDPRKEVSQAALQSPRMPASVLVALVESPDEGVRALLAEHPNTPPETLLQLATDPAPQVRAAVTENPKVPPEALQILSADPIPMIRARCAYNPSLSPELLARLSQDPLIHARAAVAENAITTAEILTKLSQDVEEFVRQQVAKNPNTPNETLDLLSQDPDEKVRNAARDTLREKSESIVSCVEK